MLKSFFRTAPAERVIMRSSLNIRSASAAIFAVLLSVSIVFGQSSPGGPVRSQEYSESDGVPVLIKHLPNWESVRQTAVLARDVPSLKAVLGERPALDLIDFSAGTEAATAAYPEGKLLIIEYSTPQASVDADGKFTSLLSSGDGKTAYKRIGNYNVLVFDASDLAAANALIDQVKYEKNIQWLGPNPFRISAERAFVLTTSDIFFSTVLVILMGIGISIVGGLITGWVFFLYRERRRAEMTTYTDAGGMTRLNLDGFTPDIVPKGLLGD